MLCNGDIIKKAPLSCSPWSPHRIRPCLCDLFLGLLSVVIHTTVAGVGCTRDTSRHQQPQHQSSVCEGSRAGPSVWHERELHQKEVQGQQGEYAPCPDLRAAPTTRTNKSKHTAPYTGARDSMNRRKDKDSVGSWKVVRH